MITVEPITYDAECEAYECKNSAEFLIGGLNPDFTEDKYLCRSCLVELSDKIQDEIG